MITKSAPREFYCRCEQYGVSKDDATELFKKWAESKSKLTDRISSHPLYKNNEVIREITNNILQGILND